MPISTSVLIILIGYRHRYRYRYRCQYRYRYPISVYTDISISASAPIPIPIPISISNQSLGFIQARGVLDPLPQFHHIAHCCSLYCCCCCCRRRRRRCRRRINIASILQCFSIDIENVQSGRSRLLPAILRIDSVRSLITCPRAIRFVLVLCCLCCSRRWSRCSFFLWLLLFSLFLSVA